MNGYVRRLRRPRYPSTEALTKDSNFENRYVSKDGSIQIVSWTATPVPAAGLLYCVGRDMTERKRIHRELEHSEERHRAITETAHDAILVADADGTVRFWNPVAERVFGFAAAPPPPRKPVFLMAPITPSRVMAPGMFPSRRQPPTQKSQTRPAQGKTIRSSHHATPPRHGE